MHCVEALDCGIRGSCIASKLTRGSKIALFNQHYFCSIATARILVELLTDTAVNVSWENVTVPGIVSYTVYYRPTVTMNEQSVTLPSSESSVVIEGLMTGMQYNFQVAVTAELEGHPLPGERSMPFLVTLPRTLGAGKLYFCHWL